MRRLLIMDLFGVIITEDHIVSNLIHPLVPEMELPDLRTLGKYCMTGSLPIEDFWKSIGVTPTHGDDEVFLHLQVDPDFEQTAKAINKRADIAILSNAPAGWRERIEDLGITKHVIDIVLSGEHGIHKPDSAAYQLVCERNRIDPKHCIMVDDNISNLAPAADLGMKTIWMRREPQESIFSPDHTIVRLSDLQRII